MSNVWWDSKSFRKGRSSLERLGIYLKEAQLKIKETLCTKTTQVLQNLGRQVMKHTHWFFSETNVALGIATSETGLTPRIWFHVRRLATGNQKAVRGHTLEGKNTDCSALMQCSIFIVRNSIVFACFAWNCRVQFNLKIPMFLLFGMFLELLLWF